MSKQYPFRKDLTGQTFGKLTVLHFLQKSSKGTVWQLQCSCGNLHTATTKNLAAKKVQSCGCSNIASRFHNKYGVISLAKQSLEFQKNYARWKHMKNRCFNPKDKSYPQYGGRGISICDRWKDSLENFITDMGACPEGHSLDRIDVNGNYEPENCRWATITEQNNNKQKHHLLTHNGKTQNVSQWAKELGMTKNLILNRLSTGWSTEDALIPFVPKVSKYITFNGKTLTVSQWTRELNLTQGLLRGRLLRGWSVEDALTK